ncbi:hypothetical protein LSTR_LSTR001817 [Laodelphax striatellus]|uniref:Uncharacterized protein n=1 Tax=Laodelphax striatellus TaxID=195883 RepID=A0A482WFS9_LAOST|nr:hypothetical protein LSTR_LSTR001817 [Laodelphax striatellus]
MMLPKMPLDIPVPATVLRRRRGAIWCIVEEDLSKIADDDYEEEQILSVMRISAPLLIKNVDVVSNPV